MNRRNKGLSLLAVIVFAFIFAIVGFGILKLADHEVMLTRMDVDKIKAFYLAEAGLAKLQEILQKPIVGDLDEVIEESIEGGSFRVVIDTSSSPCYVISTGTSGSIKKRIRAQANFLAPPFESAVFAMNNTGTPYIFQLRGTGNPARTGNKEKGGKDIINGNIFVDGDAYLYEQSSINPAPAPNPWGLHGDIGATGSVFVSGTAYVAGSITQNAEEPLSFDIRDMDYANNNTHNVSQIFADAGVSSGHLPAGNPLRDIFVKNPSDRAAECATTPGDDFFFEPSTGFIEGDDWTAKTPLHAGTDRIYYIDGDFWVHSRNDTFGFNMDGKVTIVVTGNIHISDNLKYADDSSMLGLVALGKYDSSGNLISGGNIYFGDPAYGTMYIFSAMMFAAHDFLFNTSATNGSMLEPLSGFIVTGSLSAMDKVSINRDWYTNTGKARPAYYNTSTNKWVDTETGAELTTAQINTLRHYQMIVNYDSRVRNQDTQPPGLPRGGTKIFAGFSNWEEL
jgi:hypothetical protein